MVQVNKDRRFAKIYVLIISQILSEELLGVFHFLGSSRSTKIILRQNVYVLEVQALHSKLHTEGSQNRGSFY